MTGRRNAPLIRLADPNGRTLPIESGATYPPGTRVEVETDRYRARVATEGYVSGIVGGSFEDKQTGARDLGFGLDVVDFLLEPAPADAPIPEGQYDFGNLVHGNLPKRYVEGPQICTQAKLLAPTVFLGDGFVAITLRHEWTISYPPHDRAGSVWEQTLIFPDRERFFLASDRVTTVAESPCLFLRIDLPGHIKHRQGEGFEHVFLSYADPPTIPSTEFAADFPPDARFLYRRQDGPPPERFIRSYQVPEGPWLAGMTLRPDDVYQAWCHQRGYVCMIQEIGGRPTRPGDTFGAAYLIGWFDDIEAMERAYDRHRGISSWEIDLEDGKPARFRGVPGSG
ncbi:hypothetical protein [Tautonia sociabilis]|uniref:Uncharacterized protein n=1 Tax=Tautonia sociabilis TaxID=2080755 RepID=A0A432MJ25_9BACT|nr:hypothetical protein [Tautonia sociabilis]RUL87198.1 hypothetical protein TsocGM_13290 [Tautonia sociabilis]